MLTFVAVAALVLAYLALVGAYCALRTLSRLRRATTMLARGASGRESIIEATERHIALTERIAAEVQTLRAEADAAAQRRIEARDAALRKVALVRYDAFDDMAGRMSFSLALLDEQGDGLALTAITGRSDTRVYAKGVSAGQGEHELSPEEMQAIKAALTQRKPERITRRKAS